MIYLKWLLLVPIDLLLKVTGLVFAPLFSLFVDEDGFLPEILYWFATPDSNQFGFTGDMGFFEDNCLNTKTFWGRWWVCTKWQWRNTSQGFSTFCLGVYDQSLTIETVSESGTGDLKKYFRLAKKGNETRAWELKGSVKWPFLKKRFRWRLGWKLRWHERLPAQFVFSVSPLMSME